MDLHQIRMFSHLLSIVTLLLSIATAVSSSQAFVKQQHSIPFLDLSYLTHVDANKISLLLHDNIQNSFNPNDSAQLLKIDVSSSGLGDEGMMKVMDSLLRFKETHKLHSGVLHISLEARMNHLTPEGSSQLFQSIMSLTNHTIVTKDSVAVDQAKEFQDDGNICISMQKELEKNQTENIDVSTQEHGDETSGGIIIDSLDLGFNDIGHGKGDAKEMSSMYKSLRRLVENESGSCPRVLRLDVCGLGAPSCRAIGKGLINREQRGNVDLNRSLRELYLSGNDGIGDGGIAALAAAMKTIGKEDSKQLRKREHTRRQAILEHLDVSSCGVGDAGMEAIAIAIQTNPGCIKQINLSGNEITDEGAIALSRALIEGYKKSNNYCVESIDLSNNHGISDEGAEALFEALECGAVRSLSLRSCSLKWRSAAALGTVIGNILVDRSHDDFKPEEQCHSVEVDISGNAIGKKGSKKKSSVQENVMNGMNFLSKRIKSSLKDVGLNNIMRSSSLESDDEVELMDDSLGCELEEEQVSSSKCGACEFYDRLCDVMDEATIENKSHREVVIKVGMRLCSFDEQSIEALCASCMLVGDKVGVHLHVDCTMNAEACDDEDVAVGALDKGDFKNALLAEMAERYIASENRNYDFEDDYGYDDDY